MFVIIQKNNKNKVSLNIPIIVIILTSFLLIYLLHISVVKFFYNSHPLKNYTVKKSTVRPNAVRFIEQKDDDLFDDVITYHHRFYKKIPTTRKRGWITTTHFSWNALSYPIVPNSVHYLRLNEMDFSFTNALSILSVYRNHVPMRIYIHTMSNSSFSGPFWKKIQETKGLRLILKVVPVNISNYLSGSDKKMSNTFIYNFLKLKILQEYGGIMLEKDMFIVNNLDYYLNRGVTLHWNRFLHKISDQIIIATKNSEFINKWIRGYSKECLMPKGIDVPEPFQYVQYMITKNRRYSVLVETNQFMINDMLMDLIYDSSDYEWQGKRAIWLMEDLTEPKIRSNVDMYAREFKKNKKMRTTVEEEDEEEPKEIFYKKFENCVFLEMIKTVYY